MSWPRHRSDLEVLRHRIRQELRAHPTRLGARLGLVARVDVENEIAAHVHVGDAAKAKRMQCGGYGFHLRIEEPAAWCNVNGDAISPHSEESGEAGASAEAGTDDICDGHAAVRHHPCSSDTADA